MTLRRLLPVLLFTLTCVLAAEPALAAVPITRHTCPHGAGEDVHSPDLSADGRYVAYDCQGDVFVLDRSSGQTERISVATGGAPGNGWSYWASISADGRYVAFVSDSTNFASGDGSGGYDVFLRDRQAATTTLVSRSTTGQPH